MADHWVRVWLGETPLWVEPATLLEGGEGALAPDHHVVDGKLNIRTCFSGDSYAHVMANGEIKRYHRVIGHRSDLIREAEVA